MGPDNFVGILATCFPLAPKLDWALLWHATPTSRVEWQRSPHGRSSSCKLEFEWETLDAIKTAEEWSGITEGRSLQTFCKIFGESHPGAVVLRILLSFSQFACYKTAPRHICGVITYNKPPSLLPLFDLADEWVKKTFRRNVSDVDSRGRMGPENFIRILVIFSRHVLPLFQHLFIGRSTLATTFKFS